MIRHFSYALLLVLVSGMLGACAAPNMMHSDPGTPVAGPEPGKAMVVFMRPSALGFAVHASVFDDEKFICMVPYNSKYVYMAEPGPHQFMVISEAADFMKADLVAGKTYYAIVEPRMGAWRARFSLLPVHRQDIDKSDIQECIKNCQFVVNKASAPVWADINKPSILEKKAKYYEVWMQKDTADQPYLRAEDGL